MDRRSEHGVLAFKRGNAPFWANLFHRGAQKLPFQGPQTRSSFLPLKKANAPFSSICVNNGARDTPCSLPVYQKCGLSVKTRKTSILGNSVAPSVFSGLERPRLGLGGFA